MNSVLNHRLSCFGLILWLSASLQTVAVTNDIRRVVINEECLNAIAEDQRPQSLFMLMSSNAIAFPLSELSSILSHDQELYTQLVFSEVTIIEQAAEGSLNVFLALINEQPVKQTMNKGGAIRALGTDQTTITPPVWLKYCNLGSTKIVLPATLDVPFLEVLYRAAQAVDLEVGVMDTGEFIVGRPSRWHPEYVPKYILKPVYENGDNPVIDNSSTQDPIPRPLSHQLEKRTPKVGMQDDVSPRFKTIDNTQDGNATKNASQVHTNHPTYFFLVFPAIAVIVCIGFVLARKK